MFRKVIYPPESVASRQEMKRDCKKRMKITKWTMIILGVVFLSVFIIRIVDPTFFGNLGSKIVGGIAAILIVQGINWITERQHLKRLDRRA